MFHELCRTARSSRMHKTESVSVMGHAWSVAVYSTRSDKRQQSFFDHNYLVVFGRRCSTARLPCVAEQRCLQLTEYGQLE